MRLIVSHYGMKDGGDANGFTRNINLFSELVQYGYDITFITTQKKGFKFPYEKENRSGIDIIAFPEIFPLRFRKGGIGPLSTFLKMCYVTFKKARVVYSDTGHRPNSGLPCKLHRLIHNSIYLSDWWEHYSKGGIYNDLPKFNRLTIGQFDNLFEIKNRKTADGCIVISNTLKQRAIENGISKSQILLLNTGADITKIPFHQINSQKHKFKIDLDTFVISIIGINQEEINNNKDLISGIKTLNAKGKKTVLLTTGNLKEEIIDKHEIAKYWIHFEWVPYEEFSEIISCTDLFSLIQIDNLRNRSRFPNKFGDYLSAGRPIITNAVGDLKDYADKYPQYFYVVNNNQQSIMSKLELAYDDWSLNKIDYAKIREIANENSWNERADRLDKFIKKLM